MIELQTKWKIEHQFRINVLIIKFQTLVENE